MKNTVEKLMVKARTTLDRFMHRDYRCDSTEQLTQMQYYQALGFPEEISYQDYKHRYRRQEIANRIVRTPVQMTWKDHPIVYESKDKDTKFEQEWSMMVKGLSIYRILYRTDIMGMLGRFSLLFLGFDDGADLKLPATKNSKIAYMTPIEESQVTIERWDTDLGSPRYGMPTMYEIRLSMEYEGEKPIDDVKLVHWSRVIHIAEHKLDSDVFGIPWLEPIYNRLIGIEKIAGGSPEMYWMGARPGYTAQAKDNVVISDVDFDKQKGEISSFVNRLERFIYTEGMDIKALATQVVSPVEHIETQLKMISAYTRMPIRILIGSERGELASTQDQRTWLSFIDERRRDIGETLILRPLIDRMIEIGSISPPESGEYFVEWGSLLILSEKERSEIVLNQMKALSLYVNAIGATEIIPPEVFLKDLGKSEAEIDLITDINKKAVFEDDAGV